MSDLASLIEKLEEAEGPDRSIDGMIAHALEISMPDDPAGWPPRYTESLDAAMTLIPEGCAWLARNHNGKPNHDGEGRGKRAFANVYFWNEEDDAPLNPTWANTPAIALTAAALKARAASPSPSARMKEAEEK